MSTWRTRHLGKEVMGYGHATHSIALQIGHLLLQGSAENRHQPTHTFLLHDKSHSWVPEIESPAYAVLVLRPCMM